MLQNGETCLSEARAVDYAYQPIVSTSTLAVHGFEALARPAGRTFANVIELLNEADRQHSLRDIEHVLLATAIAKFAPLAGDLQCKLFCNIDNRAYDGRPLGRSVLSNIIGRTGFPPSRLCVEVSERQPVKSYENLMAVADMLAEHDANIAIDDFGIGNSGLHMLLKLEPDFVKIDRLFIDGIASSSRQQAIVAKLCGLAHALGFSTVAEGVENEADFRMARDLGCDLAQGFHIAAPTLDVRQLRQSYDRVTPSGPLKMNAAVARLLTQVEPIHSDDPVSVAMSAFRNDPLLRLLPVVGHDDVVLGGIFEDEVRQIVMSDFGRSLMVNKGVDARASRLMRKCPVADARGTVEAIVNAYVASDAAHGLVLVKDGRFAGYLSNNAVLRLATESEVDRARQQNPLTGLPGNEAIVRHIDELVRSPHRRSLAFIDFDNFKAFNDAYGFAMGDRALLMFADMLRKTAHKLDAFAGHVGGDDFLLSLSMAPGDAEEALEHLRQRFCRDVESLYSAVDRAAGGISAIDRFGVARFYPLLTLSAGIVHFEDGEKALSPASVLSRLASAKSQAKGARLGLASLRMQDDFGEPGSRAAA